MSDQEQRISPDDLDETAKLTDFSFSFGTTTIIFLTIIASLPRLLHFIIIRLWRSATSGRHKPAEPPRRPRIVNHADVLYSAPLPVSARRYGLAVGEASGEVSEEEDDEEITFRELRRLERSPEFQSYCRSRGITTKDLEDTERRLRTYRRLRSLHPPSFWLLCNPDSLSTWETIDPGILVLSLEYIISMGINLVTLLVTVFCVWSERFQDTGVHALGLAVMILFWITCLRAWMQGRPSGGFVLGAWYVDLDWQHRASFPRAAMASVLDTVYVVGTLGAGAIVSLTMRSFGQGKSIGERIAGVRLVLERRDRLNGA